MPLYLRRMRDHYPDDYAHKRLTSDGYIILCGNLVAGSAEPISGGPSDGRWSWGASFGGGGRPSGGTVENLEQATQRIAVAFRRNIATVGLAERQGTPAGPPVYDLPPPNDLGQEPKRDGWFDRDHPRVIDWPRRAPVYSGALMIGLLSEMACIPDAGKWTWAISGTRRNPQYFTWKGQAETIELAYAQLAVAWADWIHWAGLEQREPLRQGKPVYSLC